MTPELVSKTLSSPLESGVLVPPSWIVQPVSEFSSRCRRITVERQYHLLVSSSKNARERGCTTKRLEEVIFPLSACSTHPSKPPIRAVILPVYVGIWTAALSWGHFLEMYCNCWHEALAQGNLTQCSLGVCMQHDLTHSITTLTLPYTSPPLL